MCSFLVQWSLEFYRRPKYVLRYPVVQHPNKILRSNLKITEYDSGEEFTNNEKGRAGGRCGKEERCVRTGFLWENRTERDILEDLSIYGRIILKWTGLIWLRVGTSGGLL